MNKNKFTIKILRWYLYVGFIALVFATANAIYTYFIEGVSGVMEIAWYLYLPLVMHFQGFFSFFYAKQINSYANNLSPTSC